MPFSSLQILDRAKWSNNNGWMNERTNEWMNDEVKKWEKIVADVSKESEKAIRKCGEMQALQCDQMSDFDSLFEALSEKWRFFFSNVVAHLEINILLPTEVVFQFSRAFQLF